jgi:hypothetical protein
VGPLRSIKRGHFYVAKSSDIVTIRGEGSAVAKVMASRGARVLIVERETRFKDRLRGEFLVP